MTKVTLSRIHFIRPVVLMLGVLALPFFAMKFNWQVTDPGNPYPETVNWDFADFITMGALILFMGLLFELIASKLKRTRSRIITAVVLLILFICIWIELAVGIFNSPLAGS